MTTTAPVSVTIGSLTPPAGSANAAASIAGLTPASAIGAPRAIRSVVFTSSPGGLGGGVEVAGLQLRGDRRRLLARGLDRLPLDDVDAHLAPSPRRATGVRASCLPVTVRNAKPCGVWIASLTSPSFSSKARAATAGAMPEADDRLVAAEEIGLADGEAARLGHGVEVGRLLSPCRRDR